MAEPSFRRLRLWWFIKFSINLPLEVIFEEPQRWLWALKSPSKMKGLGIWEMILSRSLVLRE